MAFRWAGYGCQHSVDYHLGVYPEPLGELSRLADARSDLDRVERRLIEAARAQGTSWSRIASALGLASRQAAEQRWLRLSGDSTRDPAPARAARLRQRTVDASYGAPILELRRAALNAHLYIEEDDEWDRRHPRAVLIRTSLGAAITAEPGALYELTAQAIRDLQDAFWPALPAGLASTLRRLKRAVAAATPRG